ncbi:MAG: hypothetical protein QNJ53_00645 [Pleurocapsa sp. MO_192.B19]|nr:hypothetical protein [Pleurocapsa sp. MO_192.B19]
MNTSENDTLFGSDFRDTLFPREGNDTVFANGGNDLVNGGSGNDSIVGGSGHDQLLGGSGLLDNDTIEGGLGNDRIVGGDGSDLLEGGFGSDTFRYSSFNGIDTIKDFNFIQNDKIEINSLATGVSSSDQFQYNQSIGVLQFDGRDFIRFTPGTNFDVNRDINFT